MRPRLPLHALVAVLAVLALAGPAAAGHPWQAPLLTIDPASLQRLTAAGRPVLAVDVRPPEAYQDGRLPGARSIPLTSLTGRRREVPADTLVVLYGGDDLEDATTAYRYLRSAGHANVFVLEGGFAAWQAQGYGVER
jgi:3-mercaptopyruvate sulfurtransferase SseA